MRIQIYFLYSEQPASKKLCYFFLPNVSEGWLVCSSTNAQKARWLSNGAMVKISREACWCFLNARVPTGRFFSQTFKYHSYISYRFRKISVFIKLDSIIGVAISQASDNKVVANALGLLTVNHNLDASSESTKIKV